jgi:hypothetical protein
MARLLGRDAILAWVARWRITLLRDLGRGRPGGPGRGVMERHSGKRRKLAHPKGVTPILERAVSFEHQRTHRTRPA